MCQGVEVTVRKPAAVTQTWTTSRMKRTVQGHCAGGAGKGETMRAKFVVELDEVARTWSDEQISMELSGTGFGWLPSAWAELEIQAGNGDPAVSEDGGRRLLAHHRSAVQRWIRGEYRHESHSYALLTDVELFEVARPDTAAESNTDFPELVRNFESGLGVFCGEIASSQATILITRPNQKNLVIRILHPLVKPLRDATSEAIRLLRNPNAERVRLIRPNRPSHFGVVNPAHVQVLERNSTHRIDRWPVVQGAMREVAKTHLQHIVIWLLFTLLYIAGFVLLAAKSNKTSRWQPFPSWIYPVLEKGAPAMIAPSLLALVTVLAAYIGYRRDGVLGRSSSVASDE
jgi:hypothetical protein